MKKILFILVSVFCLNIQAFAAIEPLGENEAKAQDVLPIIAQTPIVEETSQQLKTINISAIGDLTLGTDLTYGYNRSFMAKYDEVKRTSYFLENVKDILSKDHLTIGNFEGTLTTSTDKADKKFTFKGLPIFANILVDGSVEAVTLANNHTYDFGQTGYTDTINNLNTAGITNFGINRNAIYEVEGVKIGLVGLKSWRDTKYYKDLVFNNINDVKEKGADIIIVSFHGGKEGSNIPNSYQKNLSHYAIDNGADLVLGHHPHVLQGIENYNGKTIVYSLGNFCFGGNRNPSDKDTIVYQHQFILDENNIIVEENNNIVPCQVSSTTAYNDFKPTVATGDNGQRILDRIADYSNKLIK